MIQEILSALSDFGFKVEILEEELADLTIELAFQYGVTIYDASYIAISNKTIAKAISAIAPIPNTLDRETRAILMNYKNPF